jgi:hypothetical protein
MEQAANLRLILNDMTPGPQKEACEQLTREYLGAQGRLMERSKGEKVEVPAESTHILLERVSL